MIIIWQIMNGLPVLHVQNFSGVSYDEIFIVSNAIFEVFYLCYHKNNNINLDYLNEVIQKMLFS